MLKHHHAKTRERLEQTVITFFSFLFRHVSPDLVTHVAPRLMARFQMLRRIGAADVNDDSVTASLRVTNQAVWNSLPVGELALWNPEVSPCAVVQAVKKEAR